VIGTTLAHYRITASLGKGGMGEVWRAEDTKLGREVALKVLPEEFGSDRERIERFEREARAVASLNHPHIVTLFSVEEIDDIRFLTMELVEGRTLDQMIPDNGFEAERFFDLATPLAEAMSAAQDKSVIHRDLKPSNVMVDDDGRVKVMDFGLAKLQENDDPSISSELPTEALTGVGMVVGTVPYMSPEQIEGKIVDHRTDVFSLGVLLYEMATGVRPFIGESSPALMSSILRDAPPSVVEVRNDFPRHLGRIIGRCLEKDRRDRYQTARDVFNELRALQRESSSPLGRAGSSPARAENISAPVARPSSGPGVTVRPPSTSGGIREDEGFWVAVLPFKYTGGDADLTALAEGLSEEIVTGLSRFSYLRVIARGSTTTDARYVMEGSLRQAGRKLRIAVQLVDTESGAHLWAETYDRDFERDELFVLQDDIIPRVVSTCADHFGVLARAISEVVRGRPVAEMNSYEALMRGFGYHFRLTPEEHAEAREALEQAVEQAPSNAAGVGLRARVCPRLQPQTQFARSCARGRPSRRRHRGVESPRTTGAGGRSFLPQGGRGLSDCRRAVDGAQPDGRQQRSLFSHHLFGRMGARLHADPRGDGTQPPPSRLVQGAPRRQRVPQEGLPVCGGRGCQCQFSRCLLDQLHSRRGPRPARRAPCRAQGHRCPAHPEAGIRSVG
jgi:serine/threonine protein kinase